MDSIPEINVTLADLLEAGAQADKIDAAIGRYSPAGNVLLTFGGASYEVILRRLDQPDRENRDGATPGASSVLLDDPMADADERRAFADQQGAFDEWVATKTRVEDLGAVFSDETLTGRAGWLYRGKGGDSYIEDWAGRDDVCEGPRYYLLLGNTDWRSDDLAELERILFDEWAVPEGLV